MKTTSMIASLAATALAAAAGADFFAGSPVSVSGTAGPQLGGTTWGTSAGQGQHALGGSSIYWDSVFGDPQTWTVGVSSTVNALHVATFVINFSQFGAGEFSTLTVDIVGLKQDGTLLSVAASSGQGSTNGNTVHWQGSGAAMAQLGTLTLTIQQSPAPGALGLLGVTGLIGIRRRRA